MTNANDKSTYAAYWAAALARHRAMIAAGCLSPVGAIRVSGGRKKDNDDDYQATS